MQLRAGLMAELDDKAWKVRGEALDAVAEALKAAKRITPQLGDLGTALKARLADKHVLRGVADCAATRTSR